MNIARKKRKINKTILYRLWLLKKSSFTKKKFPTSKKISPKRLSEIQRRAKPSIIKYAAHNTSSLGFIIKMSPNGKKMEYASTDNMLNSSYFIKIIERTKISTNMCTIAKILDFFVKLLEK